MSSDPSSQPAPSVPPPRSTEGPHKLLGTLNVLFGSVLLLAGLCCGMSVAWQIAAAPMMENSQKSVQAAMREQRDRQIERQIAGITELEESAENDEERAELEEERLVLEEELNAELPEIDFSSMNSPQYIGYMATDAATGLILNSLLVISGIGLLASKEWARKMALWVAGLKIIRLIALNVFAIAVIIPAYSKAMGEMMKQMEASQPPGGPPMADMADTMSMGYAVMLSSMAGLMILFGIIYPIVLLWVLTRPKVIQACAPRPSTLPAETA